VSEPVKLRSVEEIKDIARRLVTYRHGVLAEQAAVEAAAVLGDIREYLGTLTEAQRRGSELQDEVRGLRRTLKLMLECAGSDDITSTTFDGLVDLVTRRFRGDCKYGNVEAHLALPDGTGGADAVAFVEIAKADRRRRTENGTLTWACYLEEETGEAFAESDEERLADELLDVATVALKWRECIGLRREARASLPPGPPK
jgi:hypothetical protein